MKKKELAKRAFAPLSFVNRFIPKDKKRILIYANLGFRDNAKALFDYLVMNNYNKDYQIVCAITEYIEYQGENIENVSFVSPRDGVKKFFTSKYVFYTFGQYPIKPSKRQIAVHMWHGMPLKKIGNMRMGHEKDKYNYFTYVVSPAPFFEDILQKCFNCKKSQILSSVQPKCDRLILKQDEVIENRILWMPTYRESDTTDTDVSNLTIDGEESYRFSSIIKSDKEWEKLDQYLEKLDYELWIKLHPLEKVISNPKKYKNIRILSEKDCKERGILIYDIYRTSKALISDYSSAYMDFLLLDRPVAFVIEDMHEYEKNRGFVVDNPLDYMPGPKLNTINDFIDFIDDVAKNVDEYKENRQRINLLLNKNELCNDTRDLLEKVGIKKELSLDEIKSVMLDILIETARFCDEQGLRYYLTGGTLLGAVRHKGFIPWDDDIDIQMPRPDFERLKHLFKTPLNKKYELATFENTPSHARMFARVVDKSIVYDNRFFEKKYISKLGIDIFPMDGAPPTGKARNDYFNKVKKYQRGFLWSQAKPFTSTNPAKAVVKTIGMIPAKIKGRDFYYQKIQELINQYPYEESDEVGILTGVYMQREIFSREAYDDIVNVEFEGYQFKAIKEWDAYLTKLYGDYMSLPPESERHRKHGYVAYRL